MPNDITARQPLHVNPYEQAVKNHEPAAGDYYADRSPHFNSRNIFRLEEKVTDAHGYVTWRIKVIAGPRENKTISESSLKEYYRPLLGDFEKTRAYAQMVVDGRAEEVARGLLGEQTAAPADSEALMASGNPAQVAALLDESERMQNALEEIHHTAEIIIKNKKAELQKKLDQMEEYVTLMNRKVQNLVKIITVLNLYTGKTVDLEQIASGEGAAPAEPLHLRQRILYMDEELCVHLDREADYADIGLFKQWVAEPGNRDIVVPEQRCIVALKPKHQSFEYRSGNPEWDAQRNVWNKHTYLLIRNGDNLFFSDSEDLELFGSAFPHSDFEEEYQRKMADPRTSFKDSLKSEHEQTRYRTTKYMVYLQGLIDNRQDLLGEMAVHPNLMKGDGVTLVRDDESLIGTGRLPWKQFVEQKNKSIRVGTRVVFVPGKVFRERAGGRKVRYDGDWMKYYTYESSEPEGPGAGIYSMEPYYEILRYEHGKPVRSETPTLVFRYLPGDEVWYRDEYGYADTRKRSKRVAWKPAMDHVINYDAITLDELRGYLEDRTMRGSFRDMMPLLKKTLLQKEAEAKDEKAFEDFAAVQFWRKNGREVSPQALDEAVAWWKEKVIYTRPLRSDDSKAFRMIMKRLEGHTT